MAKILSIIAPQGFQDVEYADSKAALEEAGHQVITACYEPEAVGKFGSRVKADVSLKDVKESDYDAILFVGGPGVYEYFDDPFLHQLAWGFYDAKKPTTAICAAPSILAKAGLLHEKRATSFSGERETLKAHKAVLSKEGVQQDGLLVTADGPASARQFGQKIAQMLVQLIQ